MASVFFLYFCDCVDHKKCLEELYLDSLDNSCDKDFDTLPPVPPPPSPPSPIIYEAGWWDVVVEQAKRQQPLESIECISLCRG